MPNYRLQLALYVYHFITWGEQYFKKLHLFLKKGLEMRLEDLTRKEYQATNIQQIQRILDCSSQLMQIKIPSMEL